MDDRALPVEAEVEVLAEGPARLTRPLALVNGRGYAVAWPYVRRGGERAGGEATQTLWVVRDDGQAFGEGTGQGLGALGLATRLEQRPPREQLWTTAGAQAYRRGARPAARDVFERMTGVVDRFIDFDQSLAPQATMAEFLAAYALSTWLLEAFGVVGFLWPNGDRGSGKTNLLHVVAQLSYLGTVLAASGSFASLRDLADYGATLAFDDAEQVADPRKCDPDIRALLLAGNRRGAVVPVKEQGTGGHGWQTRYVNAFCPRLFSAIQLPDPVLASRSIVVPLVRTADRARANADPLDGASWPCDRQALTDDLWGLALANLGRMGAFDAQAAQATRLAGRALQPWRAVLAVGLWLESAGVSGLFGRLEGLAGSYQQERPGLEADDVTTLVVRSLMALCATQRRGFLKPEDPYTVRMADMIGVAEGLAEQLGLAERKFTAQRLGRVLARLRLQHATRAAGPGGRQWLVRPKDLERWAASYNLRLGQAEETSVPDTRMPERGSFYDEFDDAPDEGPDELPELDERLSW